ncbi:dirigent protein 24-like [Nicotiana tabacum]|uniref:Dirigent protein n=1 Tax=Nicotiana tabacum TaxID=4097 RepID=A0A1S4CKE1_TOBAC|nr:PREDICTED: dirigent protein 24-like [Nicotiana tabacum]
MAKFSRLTSKILQATFCILLLALTFGCASSARILDEVNRVADASSETDDPVVAPVVAPAATLPSNQLPATVTAPDSDVAPVADSSIPADTVAPPADLPAEPEPDSIPVVAPAASVAPPADLPDTGAAPVADAAPVTTPVSQTPGVATATSGGAAVESPVLEHPTFSFFMHDILGGSQPSGRVVTGIVATSDANNLPFSTTTNQIFPINGGVPLNNINNVVNNNNYPFLAGLNGQQQANTVLQNSGNNNVVNGGNNQPFVTAGQLPSGLSLQQLMFGSITVVDNEITEGHELGSAVLGKAQGFYLTSSSDGTSHTLALAALFHGEHDHEVDDTISFFGIHRTATPISHIAIIGGTGKYENAKGFATIETLPHVDQHTTDGVETITHFTVYITP